MKVIYVTIAPMTTQRPHPPLPSDLLIRKGTPSFKAAGFKEESWLLIDKIASLENEPKNSYISGDDKLLAGLEQFIHSILMILDLIFLFCQFRCNELQQFSGSYRLF
jgi:hypothetical protein